MKGDEVIASGDVLVTDNRIAAVGKKGSLKAPAGTHTINVDRQDHHARPGRRALAHVGAARPAPDRGLAVHGQPRLRRDDDARSADVDAGRVRVRRHGRRRDDAGPARLRDRSWRVRRRRASTIRNRRCATSSATATPIKTNTLKQYVAGDRIVRQWIIEACKEYGITATIEGSLDLKLNLTQMADGYSGQEHSFPIMPLYKDVVEFVARTKTFYTPTILVAYGAPWSENFYFETENVVNDTKLRSWVPWELLDSMMRRRAQWFLPEEYGHVADREGRRRHRARGRHAPGSAATASCRASARTGRPGTCSRAD